MAINRWRPFRLERIEPFRDVLDIQGEMNRVFDSYFGRSAPSAAMDRAWAPPIDIYETKDELVIAAELPGVKETDVHLSIVADLLSVRGRRTTDREVKEENYHRIERWSGSFERHIQLPFPVQADKVRANFRDGVLEIRLPKAEELKPREIKIEVG